MSPLPEPLVSRREAALLAVETKLKTLPASWKTISRGWAGRVHPDQCPAALMFDGGEDPEDFTTCQLQIMTEVEIDLVFMASSAETVGPTLSEHLAEIKALFLADETLGGAVTRLRYRGCDKPDIDDQTGGSPMVMTTVRFDLLFEHSETSPYI